MSKPEKQPWNPFPLAALSAAEKYDLSAAAITVLIYCAARSNYTGWLSCGHARMCHDLRRSKDFVSTGLKELYAKGLMTASRRARKGKKADARIISQEILPPEWRSNPVEQDQTSQTPASGLPVAQVSNHAMQDYTEVSSPAFGISSPAQQGETLQNCNLAESQKNNLAEKIEVVSECVAPSLRSGSGRDASHLTQDQPQEEAEEVESEYDQSLRDGSLFETTRAEYQAVQELIMLCFAPYRISPGIVVRILKACPGMVWDMEARNMLSDWIKEKRTYANKRKKLWGDYIKSQDDLAFRLESKKDTGLYSQLLSALGRNAQEEVTVAFLAEPQTSSEDSAPGGDRRVFKTLVDEEPRGYLEGKIDMGEEPEPETPAQALVRLKPFVIYKGTEVVSVIEAYQRRQPALNDYTPNILWAFHDTKLWHIHAERQKLEAKCLLLGIGHEKEKPKFVMEDV